MQKFLFSIIFIGLCSLSFGQSDIVFSQYIETNSGSTPKGFEIMNVSDSDIDLSSTNIEIYKGTNGANCSSEVTISSGTLAAGEVWVVGSSDLINYTTSNGSDYSGTTTYSASHNGDDAYSLHLGGVIQDMIGVCGSDPGSAWSGSGVSTANQNIELKDGLCDGDTDGWTDPSTRFETVADGSTMTGFGDAPHTCTSCSNPSITGASVNAETNIEDVSATLNWTRASTPGDGVLVVMKSGSAVSASPSGNVSSLTANAAFGSGSEIGTSEYVVYKGTGTTVDITGLTASTAYHIALFEYNESDCYSGSVTGNFTTAAPIPNISFSTLTTSTTEGTSSISVNIESDIAATENITVQIDDISGTLGLLSGSDFDETATITTGNSSTSLSIDLNTAYDVADCGSETVTLQISSVTVGTANIEASEDELEITVNADACPCSDGVIAFQGFESSPPSNEWTYSGSPNIITTDYYCASGTQESELTGTRYWGNNNSNTSITFSDIDISSYESAEIEINLASYSNGTGNGADGSDYVKLFVATNGASFSSTADIEISGNSNAKWCFGSVEASSTAGSPISLSPSAGGYRSSDGYSKLKVSLPSGNSSVKIKIEAKNNASNEIWAIDDIKITGTCPAVPCSTPSTLASAASVNATSGSTGAFSFTRGNGDAALVVIRPSTSSAVAPTLNTDYSASDNLNIGSAGTTGANNFVVYVGTSGAEKTISGLTPGTEYSIDIYELSENGSDAPCYTAAYNAGSFTTPNVDVAFTETTSIATENDGIHSLTLTASNNILTTDATVRITLTTDDGSNPSVTNSSTQDATITAGVNGTVNVNIALTDNNMCDGTETITATLSYLGGDDRVTLGTNTTHTITLSDNEGNPSNAPTNASAINVRSSAATLTWTKSSDADKTIVVIKEGGAPTSPSSIAYTANSIFGNGSDVGAVSYVVYNGLDTEVEVSGLSTNQSYTAHFYAFNGDNCYKTDAYETVTFTTTEITVEYKLETASVTENGDLEICLTIENNDNNVATVVTIAGDASEFTGTKTVTFPANSNEEQCVTLTHNTDNTSCDDYDDLTLTLTAHTNGAVSGSKDEMTITVEDDDYTNQDLPFLCTSCSFPTNTANGITITSITATTATVNFTTGSDAEGTLVLIAENKEVDSAPSNSNNYTADSNFDDGDEIGTGNYVVYVGTTGAINLTGLTENATYYLKFFDYTEGSGASAEKCYLISPNNPEATFVATSNAIVYTYSGNNGSASFNNENNWTPKRTTTANTDQLVFPTGKDVTLSNVPSQTLQKITVEGTAKIILNGASSGQTITIEDNGADEEFTIASDATLGSSSNLVHYNFDANTEANVNGNFLPNASNVTLNASATINIASNAFTTFTTGDLTNNGTINIADAGSLVQGTGSALAGSGNFEITRDKPDGQASGLYNFWSTPVANETIGDFNAGRQYELNIPGTSTSDWSYVSDATALVLGKGYALTGVNSHTFSGFANNGDIVYTVGHDGSGVDNYEALGNPYPSAISAYDFVNDNLKIDGFIRLFNHDDSQEYTVANQQITVAALGNTVATNNTDRNMNLSSMYIASGQGFYVCIPGPTGGDVTFTNSMRGGENDNFKSSSDPKDRVKAKFHLQLIDNDKRYNTLFGIVEGTTSKYDRMWDVRKSNNGSFFIGSVTSNGIEVEIQSIPELKRTTSIPLTVAVNRTGSFQIHLEASDAMDFGTLIPYIFDAESNHITAILDEDFEFYASEAKSYPNRFHLVFGKTETTSDIARHLVNTVNDDFDVRLENQNLALNFAKPNQVKAITLRDASGKMVATTNTVQAETLMDVKTLQKGVYIVNVVFENGSTAAKKFVY